MGDRCFSYFNGLLYRPELYELSIILNQARAFRLYEQTQPLDGCTLAPVQGGHTRVVLGRFACLDLALRAHRDKVALYNVNAGITDVASERTPIGKWRFL